jgi:hypothetical protein
MGFAGEFIDRETLGRQPASKVDASMLSINGVKRGFNYLPLFPLTNCIRIGMEPDTHECPR